MKIQTKNEIMRECERMAKLYYKGRRLYENDYIIKTLSLRYGINQSKIKTLLNKIPTQPEPPRNKTRLCLCCGSDISHKQRNAIFCNKRCKEKHRNLRKKANKQSF